VLASAENFQTPRAKKKEVEEGLDSEFGVER
jgi:hypothetical protein